MISNTIKKPPQVYARTAGVLGIIIVVAGIFAEAFVRGKVIVSTDATATANNILASEQLFRLGFAGELFMLCCDVGIAVLLYVLLKPVSRTLALLAMAFRLVMAAISGVNALNHFGALLVLGGADYLTVFGAEQLHAMALLSLKLHTYGYHISLVFFGFHVLLLGYLVFRSGYLPKIIGFLLIIASFGYLTNSFASILYPGFAKSLFPWVLLPALIAETSLALWLLVMGVNASRWRARAT